MSDKHTGQLHASFDGVDVIDCQQCGFAHVVPLPTSNQLHELYTDDYHPAAGPVWTELEQRWLLAKHVESYEILEKFLALPEKRLLDIGSGFGLFLKVGNDRGWETIGIEPSRSASSYANEEGHKTLCNFFGPEIDLPHDFYAVVNMNNVLEHVPDPRRFIQEARNILKDNGLLRIVVPNDFSRLQKIAANIVGKDWWVVPQHHLNYFSFSSMRFLLQGNGFEILKETTSFPMELFLLMGRNYIADGKIGKQCHHERIEFDMTLEERGFKALRQELYDAMASLNHGREVIIYARKKNCLD